MGASDHINSIKDYFLELLREVESFKEAHPELLWHARNAGPDEDAS
jgi:hypothetical protein